MHWITRLAFQRSRCITHTHTHAHAHMHSLSLSFDEPLFIAHHPPFITPFQHRHHHHGHQLWHGRAQGNTPLHTACEHGLLAIPRFLLQHGADAERCNDDGETPYQVALSRKNRLALAVFDENPAWKVKGHVSESSRARMREVRGFFVFAATLPGGFTNLSHRHTHTQTHTHTQPQHARFAPFLHLLPLLLLPDCIHSRTCTCTHPTRWLMQAQRRQDAEMLRKSIMARRMDLIASCLTPMDTSESSDSWCLNTTDVFDFMPDEYTSTVGLGFTVLPDGSVEGEEDDESALMFAPSSSSASSSSTPASRRSTVDASKLHMTLDASSSSSAATTATATATAGAAAGGGGGGGGGRRRYF